jgi:hypothetical protein
MWKNSNVLVLKICPEPSSFFHIWQICSQESRTPIINRTPRI